MPIILTKHDTSNAALFGPLPAQAQSSYHPLRSQEARALKLEDNTNTPTPTLTPTSTPTETPPTDLPTCVPGTNYVYSTCDGATIVPGTTPLGLGCDDCSALVNLPFTYYLYNQPFTQVHVEVNGNLQFASDNGTYSNTCLPYSGFNYAIMPYWEDFNMYYCAGNGCDVFVSTSGSAPNRIFNIEWRTLYFCHFCPGLVNFEVRLYEAEQKFDLIYGAIPATETHGTVGVQKDTGSQHLQYMCDNISAIYCGLQITFRIPNCTTVPVCPQPAPCATNTPGITNTPTVTPTYTSTSTPTPTLACAAVPYWCQRRSPNITPDSNELKSVAVITKDEIWAVGEHHTFPTPDASLIEHWDGSSWNLVAANTTPVGGLHRMAKVQTIVPTPELWAVGDSGVLHYSGGTWTADTKIAAMNAIAAQAPNDVYAVGPSIRHYGTGGWEDATPIPSGSTLNGITMMGAGLIGNSRHVWAVGRDESLPLIMHQTIIGGAWSTVVPASTPTGSKASWLNSVDSFSTSNIWAVGGYYVGSENKIYALTEHYNGTSWTRIDVPSPGSHYNELTGVFYNNEGDLWAVGSYSDVSGFTGLHPLILRWTDTEWQQVDAAMVGVDSELLGVGTSSGAPIIPSEPAGTGNPVFVNSVLAVGRYQNIDGGPYRTLIESIIAPTPTARVTPQSQSYYEYDADPSSHYTQGCMAAQNGDSGIVVLDYGRPVDAFVGPLPPTNVYGALPISKSGAYATVTVPQIVNAAENFVLGYYNAFYQPSGNCVQASGTPRSVVLALGINNSKDNPSGTATAIPPMRLTYGHAQAWANAVATVGTYAQARPTVIPISVVAAVDFEPKWSNYDDTPTPGVTITPNSPRAWATAYDASHISIFYNFGSADGYPAPAPSATPPPVSPPGTCCSPWRVDQLFEISYGMTRARALPEIYEPQAARQWYTVKRWALENDYGALNFSGQMSGCGNSNCHSPHFNWAQAWQVFWLELNGDERTGFQQLLDYSTDIWPTP